MITRPLMLGFQLTVRLPEIIIFLLGALILGFTIHYFWSARKTMKFEVEPGPEGISENDNWKLKYYNDMDMQEKLQQQLRDRLAETKENEQILGIELEELRKEIDNGPLQKSAAEAGDYLSQLKSTQENLSLHNQHINRLLEQIQLLKDAERKYLDQIRINENLNKQILEIR